jgi:hypothetical protein
MLQGYCKKQCKFQFGSKEMSPQLQSLQRPMTQKAISKYPLHKGVRLPPLRVCSEIPRTLTPFLLFLLLRQLQLFQAPEHLSPLHEGKAVLSSRVGVSCLQKASQSIDHIKGTSFFKLETPISWLGVIVLPLMGRVAELHPFSDSSWIRWVHKLHSSTCSFTQPQHLTCQHPFQSKSYIAFKTL